MRGLALMTALAAGLVGCAGSAPQPAEKPVSYNRRELAPTDGLFTGSDGEWTVYRNDKKKKKDEAEEKPPAPEEMTPSASEATAEPCSPEPCEHPTCDRAPTCAPPTEED